MTYLTNFTDTSDVSDAAIEWFLGNGLIDKLLARDTAEVRRHAANNAWCYAKNAIIAARLIQQHHPDLLVDPVDAIVREELAKANEEAGYSNIAKEWRNTEDDDSEVFIAAKRLYLMGIEKGKGA